MPFEHSDKAGVGPRRDLRDLRDLLCRGRVKRAELQLALFVPHVHARLAENLDSEDYCETIATSLYLPGMEPAFRRAMSGRSTEIF